jgi:hypothetical protein
MPILSGSLRHVETRLLGQTVTLGQSSETDSGQAVTFKKTPTGVGQATETDTAQAITYALPGVAGRYDASAVPTSASPVWVRSGTPTSEAVSSGILNVVTPSNAAVTYTQTNGSTQYDYAGFAARAKWTSGTELVLEAAGAGKFRARFRASSTSIACEVHNGTSYTSLGTGTIVSGTAFVARIEYVNGTVTFYIGDDIIASYSGTQDTAQTNNYVLFGDDTATSACTFSIDEIDYVFRPVVKEKAGEPFHAGLTRIKHGEITNTKVRVYNGTTGHAYRIIDCLGTVIGSAVVDGNGLASFTVGASEFYAAKLVGYTDNTYATSESVWPGQGYGIIRADDIFDANTGQLGGGGVSVVDTQGSYYYPTHQYGGAHNEFVETDTYRFVVYRTGPKQASGSGAGGYWVRRFNKLSGDWDQGPYSGRCSSPDGHECFYLDP